MTERIDERKSGDFDTNGFEVISGLEVPPAVKGLIDAAHDLVRGPAGRSARHQEFIGYIGEVAKAFGVDLDLLASQGVDIRTEAMKNEGSGELPDLETQPMPTPIRISDDLPNFRADI